MRNPGTRRSTFGAVLAVLGVVVAANACIGGCSGKSSHGTEGKRAHKAREHAASAAEDAGAGEVFVEHTVQPGETLWDIAHAYGVAVSDIMAANHLAPGDIHRIRNGQKIKIPGATEKVDVLTTSERREKMRKSLPEPEDGAYHYLAEGETLWDLARAYDVSVDDIMARNGFSDSDARSLHAGQPVLIPGVTKDQIKRTEPQARIGIEHTLAYGETVWDLANAFQVSVAEIMAANGLSTEQVTQLREGMRLFIPGVERDKRTGKVHRKLSRSQLRALAKAKLLGLGTSRTAHMLLGGRVEQKWIRAAGGNPNELPGTLRWPVTHGHFVRGYGSGLDGYHQAVDIAGEIGWNVRAAARGIVAYAGNQVRGYGNIVLMVHPGGWVTMYAHTSFNYVVAGQYVPRGGIIAEVGSTGISRGPHVHFELIFDGQNCDPAPLFRPGIKYRHGKIDDDHEVVWRDPHHRPKAITCGRRRRYPKSRWVIHEGLGTGE